MERSVLVFSKDGCPFCSLLKNELRKRNVEFSEYDLTDNDLRKLFYETYNVSTVPQLFFVDRLTTESPLPENRVGGWDDVKKDWSIFNN